MYYVINLCTCEVVAEVYSPSEAWLSLEDAVQESDGFYTEDDFAIMNEEEYERYSSY